MRAIRNAFKGCEVRRCKSKNRRVRCMFCTSHGADSIILDCDKLRVLRGIRGVINDCIVIERHGILHIAVVELKGGSYSPGHTRSQLAAGANLVMDILDELKIRTEACIHLVVVASRHPYSQHDLLCSNTVRVRGKRLQVHSVRCGAQFSQVMSDA